MSDRKQNRPAANRAASESAGASFEQEYSPADSSRQRPRSELIAQPAVERGGRPAPRYYAVEVLDKPGVFQCAAYGAGLFGEMPLREWAEQVGCELVLIRWAGEGR